MATLSITSSAVKKPSNVSPSVGTAGEEIIAGQPVYLSESKLYVASPTDATTSAVVGIALNHAYEDQPLSYVLSGVLTVNAVLAAGKVYVLGASGTLRDAIDVTTGDFNCVIGIATSTTTLKLAIKAAGVAK